MSDYQEYGLIRDAVARLSELQALNPACGDGLQCFYIAALGLETSGLQ